MDKAAEIQNQDFDLVWRVNEDGTIDHPHAAPCAPELLDGEWMGDEKWQPIRGKSQQHGVGRDDFIMHNSEYIGAGWADEIASTPGLYVFVVAYWSCDQCDDDCPCGRDTAEGWALFHIPAE